MAFLPANKAKKKAIKPFRLNVLAEKETCDRHQSERRTSSEYNTVYVDAFSTEARDWLDVESAHSQETYSLKWKRGRRLGLGNYVLVWEGLLQSGQIIALKQMQQGEALLQYEDLKREVNTLLSIRHRNVINYFGIGIESTDIYILMEFVQGETLRSILGRCGPLSHEKSRHYTRQVVLGLDYLHSNEIVHRDIRAAKVMVTPKDIVKLIGFGSLKLDGANTLAHTTKRIEYWMAPEMISHGEVRNKKSEIWSLGCTVHEMATTYPPWEGLGLNSFQALYNIGMGKPIPPLPDSVSPEITSFILRCLVHDPSMRPGASELLQDDFLSIQNSITDERAQEIIDEAMESGSLQQRNVVGIITGLMGAGKTTLLHHLFGLAPPGLYTSTGVAEQSFRGLLHHILRISAGVWQRLSYKHICEVLALLMQAGMKETDIDLLASCLMQEMNLVNEGTNPILDTLSTAPASSSTLSVPNTPLFQVEKSPSCQEMVPLVKSAAPLTPSGAGESQVWS